MRFQNGKNGYIEEKTAPWLWTILFGGIYFLINGLWAGFLVWLVIAAFLYASMGPPATLLMIVVGLVMSAFAPSMIKASYLRRGWTQIDDEATEEEINKSAPRSGSHVEFAAFNGVRDVSAAPYQLFLIKRYAVEKNTVLEKFVIGEELFSTLEEAMKHASEKYESELSASLEPQNNDVEPPLFSNKKSEMKSDAIAFIGVAVVAGAALLASIGWNSSKEADTKDSLTARVSEDSQDEVANREMERIRKACGADPESTKLWFQTHKTGWAEHTEEVAKCLRTHE